MIDVLVKPGQQIDKETPMITLETEKAAMDVPAPAAGRIAEIKIKKGDKVSQGSVILVLESTDSPAEAAPAAQAPAPGKSPPGDGRRAALPDKPASREDAAVPEDAAAPENAPRGASASAGAAVRASRPRKLRPRPRQRIRRRRRLRRRRRRHAPRPRVGSMRRHSPPPTRVPRYGNSRASLARISARSKARARKAASRTRM